MTVVPDKGAKMQDFYAEPHEIGCPQHRGTIPIHYEHRVDPETGKERIATQMIEDEERPIIDPETGKPQLARFPVYGEDVGFQPDCPMCRDQLNNTYQHAEQKRLSREQAAHELSERVRTDPVFERQLREMLK